VFLCWRAAEEEAVMGGSGSAGPAGSEGLLWLEYDAVSSTGSTGSTGRFPLERVDGKTASVYPASLLCFIMMDARGRPADFGGEGCDGVDRAPPRPLANAPADSHDTMFGGGGTVMEASNWAVALLRLLRVHGKP
jgi:hypothetical protein